MFKVFELIGRYFILMGKVFSRPEKGSIYRRRIIYEMESIGIDSIGLTAIISIFIGAVITLQMCINLESPFIPQSLIGYATRETMILEFSSTVVALILSGKVGSSIASEIGTMRITEQIDALEIMGVNSASYLILPKIVAAVIFFPFLTILSIGIGILGGYLIAIATGIMIPANYVWVSCSTSTPIRLPTRSSSRLSLPTSSPPYRPSTATMPRVIRLKWVKLRPVPWWSARSLS